MIELKTKLKKAGPLLAVILGVGLISPLKVYADGNIVNKIYHPYVDALENEIELRSIIQDKQPDKINPKQVHLLSFGTTIGQSWFAEAKVIGSRPQAGNFDVEAYELELKWQLTEQGEYSADWGVLFEYEQKFEEDIQEFKIGLLAEKEFGRFSGAANGFLIQEWGDNIKDEFETALSLQARYRYSRALEPALEMYIGQDTTAIGPVLLGNINLGIRKSFNWEAGVIFGVDHLSPDQTFRLLFEYEF